MSHPILTPLSICVIGFIPTFTACQEPEKQTGIGVRVIQLDPTIWSIHQDKNSHYWFGSKEKGVFHYDSRQLRQLTVNDGLVSDEIRGFQEDASGKLYIETERGVSVYDGRSFKTLPIANPGAPSDDWRLEPDDLWFRIGSDGVGPYRFDGDSLHHLKFPTSPQEDAFTRNAPRADHRPYGLYTIYKDRQGSMWFGTASLGAARFDGESLSWHYEEQLQTTPQGGDFGTRAIFEDTDGAFWINNTRFRYTVEPNRSSTLDVRKDDGIGFLNNDRQTEFPFFLSMTQDRDGNLWMATYDTGVWKYDGRGLTQYPVKNGLTDVLLFTIYTDNTGVIWLGSHNAGAYRFNGRSFERFVSAE